MTEVLRITGLAKSFGALKATDDVSLTLNAGEIHALIGPNGAGKSTLIGQIAGWIVPDAGTITLEGADITGLSVAARAKAGLGRTFQVSTLAMDRTARQNVRIAAQARAGSSFRFWGQVAQDQGLRDAVDQVLGDVQMLDQADTPIAELSHGARRRVEVACALALEPKLLLLDEPMAGLGQDGTQEMTALLARLKSRIPILLVEHDMDAVFALAGRISVLVNGAVIASGPPDVIRTDPAVRTAYLGED
ncbi:branched-chain amino acid transport system ATP-binding protein [Rubricella aquisinus]|uniref:Branched-chain amino acid transport system ATP-binding protein n=1 Tax=Rubricella aquisinus TaxID=2028108 RepID=A0A840X8I0_9RHOB|nr:ABC transporter ATP-binding protein [Rubricella aquisinus]MBB5517027.1 branched-chain amino acid transport system ATP-binding protein [Rubricella aquisinus]